MELVDLWAPSPANVFAHDVQPVLHVRYAQSEHGNLGDAERVPEPDRERLAGRDLIREHADHVPTVPFDVGYALPVPVVPLGTIRWRLVKNAVALNLDTHTERLRLRIHASVDRPRVWPRSAWVLARMLHGRSSIRRPCGLVRRNRRAMAG